MKRPHLIEAAEAYRKGVEAGFQVGIKKGIAMEQEYTKDNVIEEAAIERVDLIWSRAHIPDFADDAKIAIKSLIISSMAKAEAIGREKGKDSMEVVFDRPSYEKGYIDGQNDNENIEKFLRRGRAEFARELLIKLDDMSMEYFNYRNVRSIVESEVKGL